MRSDVEALPAPRTRFVEDGMARAEELIDAELRAAGWATERRPFAFRDVRGYYDYRDEDRTESTTTYELLEGANLVARKSGRHPDSAILVGAHFDTVRDSPGADDNGSGVAGLLELARVLAPFQFVKTIIVAAFDMEEVGGFGSKALVGELQAETGIDAAVVFEAIAYTSREPGSQKLPPGVGSVYRRQVARLKRRGFRGDWTCVIFRGSSLDLARAFGGALVHVTDPTAAVLVRDPVDLPVLGPLLGRVAPWTRNFARSDHLAFWDADVPAIQVTDTANFRNPHYHEPTDTPDTLDYDRIGAIVAATAAVIARFAELVPAESV
jgi:Zn-dependent M28 family amino/carboxypeptidase